MAMSEKALKEEMAAHDALTATQEAHAAPQLNLAFKEEV
jgi:hypothetical protein